MEYGTLGQPQRDIYDNNIDCIDETAMLYQNTAIPIICTRKAELSNYNKVHLAHKAESIYLILHIKRLSTPILESRLSFRAIKSKTILFLPSFISFPALVISLRMSKFC